MVNVWVVIATKDRQAELNGLLSDLPDPGGRAVVVDNGSDPPVQQYAGRTRVIRSLLRIVQDPPNLSALWNAGLDEADRLAEGPYEVAVLNDDLRVPEGTLEALAEALRLHDAAAAFPDVSGQLKAGHVEVLREAKPHNLWHRMTGYCFLLRGELGLRLDERFRWWAGDDDLEWRAATMGGVARVGGLTVEHLHPNGSTHASPVLTAQAHLDLEEFGRKWNGVMPW